MRKLQLSPDQISEIKRQYKLLKNPILEEREYDGNGYSDRNPFARDYSRILYSSAFRRLQGKMQILGINSAAFYRNRLTHSLEVEQIAHSIAKLLSVSCGLEENMYNDDILVIHAAALAHDIGHPAFGHKGERVLNELGHMHDLNFEGNAQNFKILRRIEKKDSTNKGLNLTWRTLLALNKYNVKEDKTKKKFIYSEDYDKLQEIRNKTDLKYVRTLDVQIIELADDIAYAVHDLEDALSLGLFTIDDILYEYSRKENTEDYEKLKKIVEEAQRYSLGSNSYDTQEEYSKVFRCRLTSLLTDKFVNDITLSKVSKDDSLKNGVSEENYELSLNFYNSLCHSLKSTIFTGVMRSPDVTFYELKGEAIIKSLFYLYAIDDRNKKCILLPMEYRPKEADIDNAEDNQRYVKERVQNSIDYIAGMMDTYAIQEYEKYFSVSFDSISLDQVNMIDKRIRNEEKLLIEKYTALMIQSGQNTLTAISGSKVELQQNDAKVKRPRGD